MERRRISADKARLFGLATVVLVGGLSWTHRSSNQTVSKGRVAANHELVEQDSFEGAQKWWQLGWRDESGGFPVDGLRNAMAERKRTASRHSLTNGFGTSMTWTNVGPNNQAGRCNAILIDPNDSNRILEGTAGGGIWLSTDGGLTMNPVGNGTNNLSISCMTRDPNTSTTIYAGTGEIYNFGNPIQGAGILKSTDNGDTWTTMPGTEKYTACSQIAVQTGNSNVILVAATGGILRSKDGGVTFTYVLDAPGENGWAVSFDPVTANNAICSIAINFGDVQAGYSVDGGVTWTAPGGYLGKVNYSATGTNQFTGLNVAYAPSDPTRVYAFYCYQPVGTNGGSASIAFVSDDGGHSYAAAPSQFNVPNQGQYDDAIWVSPTDKRDVVFGGINCYISREGSGSNFYQISNGGTLNTTDVHSDIHCFATDPHYDGVSDWGVYVASDGGVYRTVDILGVASGEWTYIDKAISAQYYAMAANGASDMIIGGLQDNGTLAIVPNKSGYQAGSWNGGDGAFVAIDPTDPTVIFTEEQYGSYLRRSDSNGQSDLTVGNADIAAGTSNFVTPFVLDPNSPTRLWMGCQDLWLNGTAKSGQPTWFDQGSESNSVAKGNFISAVAVGTGSSNIVWFGRNDGTVVKTSDGLSIPPHFTQISGQNASQQPLPIGRMVTRIVIDPANSQHVYVCFGGFSASNIWRTTDGGATWTDLTQGGTNGLPKAPIRAFAQDPGNPSFLFAGTEVGVFWSLDYGNTWTTTDLAPSNISINDLQFMTGTRTLVAATNGRGMWTASYNVTQVTFLIGTVVGGGTAQGHVYLGAPTTNDMVVNLVSSNPKYLTVPATVTIPAGSDGVAFKAPTTATSSPVSVTVTATPPTAYSSSASTAVSVIGISPSSITISPATIVGNPSGPSATGTVTLAANATGTGQAVSIKATGGASVTRGQVVVPAGKNSIAFSISSPTVSVPTTSVVTATANLISVSGHFVIEPPAPTKLSFAKTGVQGGSSDLGTVVISLKAPASGVRVVLSADNAALSLPASVLIPSGKTSATFVVTASSVKQSLAAHVTATTGVTSITANIGVLAPYPLSVVFSPSSAVTSQNVTCTLTMNGTAPAGGLVVPFTTTPAGVLTQSAFTIAAGSSTGAIDFYPPAGTITIKATSNGYSASGTLKVKAIVPVSVAASPLSVKVGDTTAANLMVTLSDKVGDQGLKLTVTSSDPKITFSPNIFVNAGATTRTIPIDYSSVTAPETVTLTVTANGVSKTAVLTITK